MSNLTAEATGLIREMLLADGGLPEYNEDLMQRCMGMTRDYSAALNRIMTEVTAAAKAQAQQQQEEQQDEEQQQAGTSGRGAGVAPQRGHGGGGGGGSGAVDWQQFPESSGAVVIYHELIMKLKRILLTYIKMRADVICRIRWEERRIPRDLAVGAEQQFAAAYDDALREYFGFRDSGIGMDLTTDLHPPKDTCVKVRVLKSHGSMALSHSAKVSLVKGSVHNMQCSEAEPLIRKGVLQVLDANC